jgi:hypothetical protein
MSRKSDYREIERRKLQRAAKKMEKLTGQTIGDILISMIYGSKDTGIKIEALKIYREVVFDEKKDHGPPKEIKGLMS